LASIKRRACRLKGDWETTRPVPSIDFFLVYFGAFGALTAQWKLLQEFTHTCPTSISLFCVVKWFRRERRYFFRVNSEHNDAAILSNIMDQLHQLRRAIVYARKLKSASHRTIKTVNSAEIISVKKGTPVSRSYLHCGFLFWNDMIKNYSCLTNRNIVHTLWN